MKGPVLWRRSLSACVVKLEGVPVATSPWLVSDELWELVGPLLAMTPKVARPRAKILKLATREAGYGFES